jgi:hypothetical protein
MILKTIRVGGLIGLSLVMMAISTAPASASGQFKSATGQGKVVALSEAVLEGGGGKITCPSTGYTGEYHIVKPIKATQPKWEEQEASNPGQDLKIRNKFPATGCEAVVGTSKSAAEVSECSFHVQSETAGSPFTSNGSVLSPCVIKALNCEIKVLQGNEIKGVNSKLTTVKGENKGKDLFLKSEVSGITTEVKAGCILSGSNTNKFKAEVLAEGLNHL